jgi:U3 small nucleolar RNA-associated protein MPP10
MAPRKPKTVREFIPMGVDDSSDDDLVEALNGQLPNERNIGLEDDYSDDGEALYSDDDYEESDEDREEEEAEEEEAEGEFGEGGFDDGVSEEENEDDVSSEGEEPEGEYDEDETETRSEESHEDEPVSKKPRGLGELGRKLAALEKEIADIESRQIDKKDWTLTGEVNAKSRPLNSILEANIELPFGHMAGKRLDSSEGNLMEDENDFDPENPEKPSFDIELIIKQRVADRTFDDVLRKIQETKREDNKPKDRLEGLDFEKSKLGLAEVYEKQYEKDVFNQSEEVEKQNAEKEDAKQIFAKLMHKLDCLTNFNFAPRPPVVKKGNEAGGVKDLPAMKLEEPIPLIVSSSVRANRT